MADVKDFGVVIGSLLSGITLSRVMSDLESVRTAKLYAGDPLLKNMPVPRVRLQEAVLEFPLAIEEVVEPEGTNPLAAFVGEYKPPTAAEGRKMLDAALSYAGITPSGLQRKKLDSEFQKVTKRFAKSPAALLGASKVAAEIRRTQAAMLGTMLPKNSEETPRQLTRFGEAVQRGMQQWLGERLERLTAIKTRPMTRDVQAAGDPSMLLNVRLTISEESYEMSIGEDDFGDQIEYFSPE